MRWYLLYILAFTCRCGGNGGAAVGPQKQRPQKKQLITLHKWTRLELSVPLDGERNASAVLAYNADKLLPVDLEVEYGDDGSHRTFLTVPRLSAGVPYTLAVVANNSVQLNPRLEPYPSAEWHATPASDGAVNCSAGAIVSAMRTYIDECWRLWVIDSGQMNAQQRCAPQLLAFDLVNDKLVHRYTLPPTLYTAAVSVFTALAVDVKGVAEPKLECLDAMAYIADPWGHGLIVYDALAGKSWRIENEFMRPDRRLQTINAANDGIFTVSFSPRSEKKAEAASGRRQLYFHALNSYREIAIPLDVINNASQWLGDGVAGSATEAFRVLGERGTQCESEIMDNAGNLYCSLINSNALIAWREQSEYNSDKLKVVAYSPQQLKFVTGLKINRNSADEDELWALSSEPTLFVGGQLETDNIKFQIIGCRTSNLQENEPCTVEAKQQ